jgi:hypothetical protein
LGRRKIEKIVPTEPLTSVLEEPSSGSKTSRYLPRGYWGQVIDVAHLFGGHSGDMTGPFVAFDEQVVGDDVQFFLGFALNVFGVGGAENA